MFGQIIDTACIIWSASCSEKGACALYDNNDFRIKKHTFEIVPKLIAICLYVLVFFRARRKTDWSVDSSDSDEEEAGTAMMADPESELSTFPKDPIFKPGRSSQ